MNQRAKAALCMGLLITLFLMFLPWFGFARGVQEIRGTLVLFDPIALAGVVLACLGIGTHRRRMARLCTVGGFSLLLLAEAGTWLLWYTQTVDPVISLQNALDGAFWPCYVGMALTLLLLGASLWFTRKPPTS